MRVLKIDSGSKYIMAKFIVEKTFYLPLTLI